jgi:hypothetical protein
MCNRSSNPSSAYAALAQQVAASCGCVAIRWWRDSRDPRFLCIEAALLADRAVTVLLSAFLGYDELCADERRASP